ncbi:hypothetical protein ASPACDRAFT_117530 [Aspergillus aculeatus ATCC 16872]|uniref:MOSC domain-containing protein n=1 Tax=Aspergillus aculeatus (strain ATCC 16872 / CBS 172.66 / WB 5094) TaxID=690307 RepID=A0A1L9WXN7_ASPA1|nr:uncharacterized protein ASPACDRAFT_117530 [Aspergillus aculeatus ATCC 16872]OJK00924.1 hypothetical protein ASPACDRAFT_117530 [Aspergillus aculeatus ATCC 16872]
MADLVLLAIIVLPLVLFLPGLKTWLATHLPHALTTLTTLRRNHHPKQSHEIVALRVYPIKSCRGLTLPRTTLLQHGLDLDRRWMIVDAATHEFLTIRTNPRMTLITTALSSSSGSTTTSDETAQDTSTLNLTISLPASSTSPTAPAATTKITIPAHPTPTWLAQNTTLASDIKIWDTTTDGYIYSSEINAPISEFLNREVALVYKGPTPRILQGNGAPRLLGREQATNFPDVHPVLIASEASLDELNERLLRQGEKAITVERFRPNVVVRGRVAWEEDTWKTVRVVDSSSCASAGGERGGEGKAAGKGNGKGLELDIVARCARCQVPNVEPTSAEKHKKQPWDTLMAYRRVDEGMKYKPCFGMLSAPRHEGEIAVGMRLEVLEETAEHRYIAGF